MTSQKPNPADSDDERAYAVIAFLMAGVIFMVGFLCGLAVVVAKQKGML